MKLLLIFFFLIILSLQDAVPCGRCVGQAQVCSMDSCLPNLICTTATSNGGATTARICYPSVAPGAWCNSTVDYNPCQSGFTCDKIGTGNCIAQAPFAQLNDGCSDNKYCVNGLSCQSGTCQLGSGQQCNGYGQCPWNNYCDMTNNQNKVCSALPGPGDNCNMVGSCKYQSGCTNAGICVAFFSIPLGGKCDSVTYCQSGLDCYQNVCVKPQYHFLNGPGAIWGDVCDPALGDAGCTCNYGTNTYMYLIEFSDTIDPSCQPAMTNLQTCMTAHSCSNINTGDQSCMRQFCYPLYNAIVTACSGSDATLRPLTCDANEMIMMFLLVIIFILL